MFKCAATRRRGPRPTTTPTNPHSQLDQNAPPHLQEAVFDYARGLAGVRVADSLVSVPGARAFHLPEIDGASDAFMIGGEFAHLHPSEDGSLHATLPPDLIEIAIDNGWAERHPLAGQFGLPGNIAMIYGPRNDEELGVVLELIGESYAYASPGK